MWWRKAEVSPKTERLAREIERFEIKSERLIGWVQLGVGAFVAFLYLASPRPIDAMLMAQPVPLALGFYLVFTLLRLVLSYRMKLPPAFLLLSIVVDISLVYGLVWYFHIQYAQDPSFSLRAPTVMYVFAFIAMRALRFEPVWVVASGVIAAVGWIGMTIWAVRQSGMDTVTRSFVAYMNGDGILIGAEMEKVMAILTVTTVLALAISRAKQLLGRATQEQLERAEIRRFLPADVERAITGSAAGVMAGDAEEREAAIVFLDIRGFTSFARQAEPQAVVDRLVGLHALIVPIIERHGGIVDKYLGDGLLASFGAARPLTDAAAAGMRALSDILTTANAWSNAGLTGDSGTCLRVNGSITAGRIVFAALGDDKRLEYTVIGDVVNLAAKLEKHNKAEGTLALTTRQTFERAVQQGFSPASILSRPLADRSVAGVGERLDLVALEPLAEALMEASGRGAGLPNRDDRSLPGQGPVIETIAPAGSSRPVLENPLAP